MGLRVSTAHEIVGFDWDGRLTSSCDAARRLGISPRMVRKFLRDDARAVGREIFYPSTAVDDLEVTLARKRCPWCGKQALPSSHNVTCGHPICAKRQRQAPPRGKHGHTREELSRLSMSPDSLSRRRIAEAMRAQLEHGEVIGTAVLNVALAQRESPASVISVWRSVNL